MRKRRVGARPTERIEPISLLDFGGGGIDAMAVQQNCVNF